MSEQRSQSTHLVGVGLARLSGVVAVWALTFVFLSRYGVDLMPRCFARQLTLEAYLALVQVATLGLGCALSFALLDDPRRALGWLRPSTTGVAYALALTPAVFVLATGVAFAVAKPTLMAELLRGGAQEVQKNTGEFGRELVQSPPWLTFLWGAIVSPVGEEAFFRGALFTLVAGATARLRGGGVIAIVVVALVFGWLHHDMPGGLGIVRFVSALGLGLACGVARQATGSVVPAVLVHVGFNALSVATVRRLVVTSTFPMKSGVPTLVAAVAAVLAWGVALRFLLARRAR